MTEEVIEMHERLQKLDQAERDLETYHDQVATLEAEVALVSLARSSSTALTDVISSNANLLI